MKFEPVIVIEQIVNEQRPELAFCWELTLPGSTIGRCVETFEDALEEIQEALSPEALVWYKNQKGA